MKCVKLAVGLLCLSAGMVFAENLLKNSGFEQVSGGVPTFWQRQYNEKLSGPFEIVSDASEGKRAVTMMTGE